MKKLLLALLGLFGVAYGQTIGYLRYDSVKMAKPGGYTELILENSTKGVTGGVLTNLGNGRTGFVASSGTGTVTNFSSGSLSPLFTSSVANSTTAPALSFTLSSTSQYKLFGRKASGSGVPSFIDADSSVIIDLHSEGYYNTKYLNLTWLKTGNSSIDTSVNWLGTNDANDLRFNVNGGRKFTMNTAGAFGIGAPADYGTSGYVLQSAGSGASPAWVNYTLQKAMTAGSTLNTDNTIDGGGYIFNFSNAGEFFVGTTASAYLSTNYLGNYSQVGNSIGGSSSLSSTRSGLSSFIETLPDSIRIQPSRGNLFIDTITNVAARYILHWDKTTGLVSYADSTAAITASSTTTFTNKRWTARVGSTTSSATPTINTDNYDIYKLTAQAADISSMTSNLSGTPVDGDILEIQITGTAARAITWGASFVSTTVTLPTTTTTTTTLTVVFQYYTTSSYGNNKWACVNYY